LRLRLACVIVDASLDDVRPELLPDLQWVNVAAGGTYLDAITPEGVAELGLAATFPTEIPHPPCQGIGLAADRAGLDGVEPLSAVAPTQKELVVFERGMYRADNRASSRAWSCSISRGV